MIPYTGMLPKTRVCKYCSETETCQWRRGPDGKASLCNACGLKFNFMMRREKEIPPNDNPQPIPLEAILNKEEQETQNEEGEEAKGEETPI